MITIMKTGAPTIDTKGLVGQHYIDLDSGTEYECVDIIDHRRYKKGLVKPHDFVSQKVLNGVSCEYVWEKIGEHTSSGGGVQPDWNQNDPTAPDYVKNRTHYEEIVETNIEIPLDEFVIEEGFSECYRLYNGGIPKNGSEIVINIEGQEIILTCQGDGESAFAGDPLDDSFWEGLGEHGICVYLWAESDGISYANIIVSREITTPVAVKFEGMITHVIPIEYVPQTFSLSNIDWSEDIDERIYPKNINIPMANSEHTPGGWVKTSSHIVFDEETESLRVVGNVASIDGISGGTIDALPMSVGETVAFAITSTFAVEKIDNLSHDILYGYKVLFMSVYLRGPISAQLFNIPIYRIDNWQNFGGMFMDKDDNIYTVKLKKEDDYYNCIIKRIL